MTVHTEQHQDGRSTLQAQEKLVDRAGAGDRPQMTLEGLAEELKRQGNGIRRTQQAFTMFAVLALLIALANLIAVAAKLGTKEKTTVVSAAATPAKTSHPPALAHTASVALREFSVVPAVTQAAAGKFTFHVHNTGAITHEFVVIRTNKAAGDLLKGARADETGNVGETGDLRAGRTKNLTLNLKPGHYAFICNLPGHYKAGQHADFTVK